MKRIDEAIAEMSAGGKPEPERTDRTPSYEEEFPRWYFLDTGVLLRRLKEVEFSAEIDGTDKDKSVADWIRGVALELACQLDNPSDPAARAIVESSRRRMKRFTHSHFGNESGKRGGARPGAGRKNQKEVDE